MHVTACVDDSAFTRHAALTSVLAARLFPRRTSSHRCQYRAAGTARMTKLSTGASYVVCRGITLGASEHKITLGACGCCGG